MKEYLYAWSDFNSNNYGYEYHDLVFRYPTDIVCIFRDNFCDVKNPNTFPYFNIIKEDNKYILEIAVAGYKKDEIKIKVKDDLLLIRGEKNEKDEREYLHKGISNRKFKALFKIEQIDTEKIKSRFDNGLLIIELPIEEIHKEKEIKIE